jgi:type II secretory pathway component GspD/PulD (secretin)
MRFRIFAVDVSRIAVCLCVVGAPLKAQTNIESRPDPETEAADMTAITTNRVDKRGLPFTTDTQVRLMGLFEPTGTNSPILPVAAETNESPYLAIEAVPLRSVFKLLARSSGLNYLEPEADQITDEEITLQMAQPKPRELMDFLLKHRGLELFDAGTGLYTVRKYTNQLAFYKFKLKDNFIDRFKGGAQSAPTGGGAGYSGAGNAVSASAGSVTVENGGKYGEIESLLEKVANVGDEKNNKVWYYEEKQQVLLYGTRQAADRVSQYLEIANAKNPNIRIDVRIFATTSNPMSRMGVDWASMLSPGLTFGLVPPGSSVGGGTNSFSSMSTIRQLASSFGNPMSSIVLRNDISATLNFFVNDQKGETVAQPSTITANGREVAFAATQQIPYISGSSVAVGYSSTGSGVGYDNTSFVNVGTTINILPRIQDGIRLKLGTAISVSQLDQFVTVSSGTQGTPPRQVPQTSGRAFNGEFTLDSGDTVVIAGLRTSTSSKSRNKVPYLGDIPGLGKLFRNEQDKKDVNYLTIFITATILNDHNEPKIPEGKLKPEDSQPDEESTLSAEANSSFLLRKSSWTDKALVHARKQALDLRTEQANQIIARRMETENHVHDLSQRAATNALEIRELEQKRRTMLEREGAIDGIVQSELETKLTRSKADQMRLFKDLQESRENLTNLRIDEEAARTAVESAEEDYTTALKTAIEPETKSSPPAPGTSKDTIPEPQKAPSKPLGADELKQNARLLDQLK